MDQRESFKENLKYFELNENTSKLCDEVKEFLREKFIASNVYIMKEKQKI